MSINVVESIHGKFHHFHLARYLQDRGMLQRIYSAYPASKLKSEGIQPDKLRSFPPFWLLWRAYVAYAPQIDALDRGLCGLSYTNFDRFVASQLRDCDVLIGLAGSNLKAGQTVQRQGGKHVCDVVASHIGYRNHLLEDEYSRWGQTFRKHPLFTKRELQEYENCDAIAVPSEFVRRSFLEMGVPDAKLVKIPLGSSTSRFSKVADPPEDVFNVLFVGQVSIRKGVPYLLKAFKEFSHPRKHLKVVGAIHPGIKEILGREINEHVEFTGPLPHAELKNVMSTSHVMVLPSIEEGLALVQGEALACGCPIISSTNTGAEDIIEHGKEGFIVPIREPKNITEHLEQLAQDPDARARMSAAAQERVKTLGGWDTYGRLYVELIERLAGKSASA